MAAVSGSKALHELIAVRAYELWESHGRPYGCELINWRQAEQEIMSCLGAGDQPVVPSATSGQVASHVR